MYFGLWPIENKNWVHNKIASHCWCTDSIHHVGMCDCQVVNISGGWPTCSPISY